MVPLIQNTILRLQMLLAEIKGREGQLESSLRQFRHQLQRTNNNTLQGNLSLEASLAVMGEVQERLEQAERTLKLVQVLKGRAQQELEALELTATIQHAQRQLASLQRAASPDEATLEEVRRLETLINEYSLQAARSITQREPLNP